MTMRNNLFALLFAIAAGAATVAHAQVKVVSVDYGIETSTDTILMPSSNLGSVVLTCKDCLPRTFPLTSQTTFLIGDRPATFAAFGAFLRTAGSRGAIVFVKPDGKAVTRIRVSAGPATAAGK
jgi:hypothetical protein